MSKVSINTSTLTAIGDAIREKIGKNDLIAPGDMPQEIRGIVSGGGSGGVEIEPIELTGNCQYAFANSLGTACLNQFSDYIQSSKITTCNSMFYGGSYTNIPFDINCDPASYSCYLDKMFYDCKQLKNLPRIYNVNFYGMSSFCENCQRLREIPEDYFDTWNFSSASSSTSSYSYTATRIFCGCSSLRRLPLQWVKHMNAYATPVYESMFNACYNLDEIANLPIPYTKKALTSNVFSSWIYGCNRLKNLTFATNADGTSIVVQWKSQTLDMTGRIGYTTSSTRSYILNYNSGITADKEVKDDATYQALKNDPDWFTQKVEYSRYNHDSAVATINSLPDTSAYLATAGGTNTIKFEGAAGSATDGGAINTLTEEEIAVAAAKGWTVTLA